MTKTGLHVGMPLVLDTMEPIEIIDEHSGLKAAYVERYAIQHLSKEWVNKTEGFYVLLSEIKPDNSFTAYVGKTDWSFTQRLISHDKNKDFWRLAILFKKSNGEFQSNQTSYMEGELVKALSSSKNVKVTNEKITGDRNFAEWNKPYMDSVLLSALRILFLRGYRNSHLGGVTTQLETMAQQKPVDKILFEKLRVVMREIQRDYPESQKSYSHWASNNNLKKIIDQSPKTLEELSNIKFDRPYYTRMLMLGGSKIIHGDWNKRHETFV